MSKLIQFLEKPVGFLSKYLAWISQFALLAIMFFTTADVFGRYALDRPIWGSYEISQFMLVVVIMFGLAYTQAQGRHISVKILVDRFPPRLQAALDSVLFFVGLLIVGLIVYAGFRYAMLGWTERTVSEILYFPVYPFRFLVPVGAFVLALELLLKWLRSIVLLRGKEL